MLGSFRRGSAVSLVSAFACALVGLPLGCSAGSSDGAPGDGEGSSSGGAQGGGAGPGGTTNGSSGAGSGGAVAGAGQAGAMGPGGASIGGAGSGGGAGSSGGAGSGGAGSSGGYAGAGGGGASALQEDPGTSAWALVPEGDVPGTCRLDVQKLREADAKLNTPWAIVRYGQLCHELKSEGMAPAEAWSTTKTLGAVVSGIVAYQTRAIVSTGRKTGPFTDEDRVDHWLDAFSYNPEAHVAHVLSMVAHNPSLALGQKTMSYDTIGTVQINTLSDMLNAAIRQDSVRLGANVEEFTQRFVYGPLGMHESVWSNAAPDKVFAYGWSTTVRDMARIGLLMLNGGVWSGEQLLLPDWIYRMTHPAFEDANTGYGYLTWLNSASNHHYGGIPAAPAGLQQGPQSPGPCAPVAVYGTHPHGLSDSVDCNYSAPYSCNQPLDVGVWQAVGLGGQVIQGHPGLGIVIVARDVTPLGTGPTAPAILWDAVRPAIIAGDPTYHGDEAAFCAAYGSNSYAPDAK